MRKRFLLLIPVGLVVLLVFGVLLYTKVIAGDPPKRLAFTDGPMTTGGAAAGVTHTTAAPAGRGVSTARSRALWKVVLPSTAGS